eukprot:4908140-Prymnesium_polylepis.1
MLTAYSHANLIERGADRWSCQGLGADGFLQKPIPAKAVQDIWQYCARRADAMGEAGQEPGACRQQ